MSVDVSSPPDSPAAIDAVPLRHPWRWVAAIVIVILVGAVPLRRGHQRGLRLGHLRQVHPRRTDRRAASGSPSQLTIYSMVLAIVLGGDPRGHAAVAQPGVPVGVLGVSLDLPRHAGLRAVGVLGPVPDDLQEHPAGHSVRADVLPPEHPEPVAVLPAGGPRPGLNEAAYLAEIIRAGISSVPEGQSEASTALGMSWMMTMRRTVLPQAMRVIIPPTGNEFIGQLKTTSLVAGGALHPRSVRRVSATSRR